MRNLTLLVAFLATLQHIGRSKVLWKGCVGIADNPRGKDGFYYDLCIQKHEFSGRRAPFQFIGSVLTDVVFDACTFVNTNQHSVNFTGASFSNVLFKNSVFGSYVVEPKPVELEKFAFRHVRFERCRFDKSAELTLKSFEMTNVTFSECIFESDTLFQRATMQEVTFSNCKFQRSPNARAPSANKWVNFNQLTMRTVSFVKSTFLQPIIFEGVNAADVHFNDTTFEQPFWCHSRGVEADSKEMQTSAFNDTIFQRSTFDAPIECGMTTWRTLSMWNTTFAEDADFSKSRIQDVNWNTTVMNGDFKGGCTTLDFSESTIYRGVLTRMKMACEMDLRKTQIEKVYFDQVRARRYILKEAQFKQERIDGRCCTAVCPEQECRCNYSRPPTDNCPKVPYPTDLNAPQTCFPGGASLAGETGLPIKMANLRHGERVAVGSGSHSDVYFFGHHSPNRMSMFVEISHTGQDKVLRISPGHYLYVNDKLATAESVKVGDTLVDSDGFSLIVTDVNRVMDTGLYAPTSLHGDLIVDGVRVSSYTSAIHPTLAHHLLSPLRLAYRVGLQPIIRRFTTRFHENSYEPVARFLRLPQGPEAVDL